MNEVIKKRTLLTAILGNVFEAYDIAAFLYLAPFLAQTLFPPENYKNNVLKIFGIFLIGFLIRPIGGIVLGMVADIYGRKKSLVLSVLLASVSTTLIIFIPSYESIGTLASFLLICSRVGQSFALGGEYVTSVAYLIEHASSDKRGYAGSWAAFGANAGVLIASMMSLSVTYVISKHPHYVWLWRLPFLFSLIGIMVCYWMRKYALETLSFILENSSEEIRTPKTLWCGVKQFMLQDKTTVFAIMGLTWTVSSSYYIVFTYASLHQTLSDSISKTQALTITLLSVMLLVVLAPVIGKLSDKMGRGAILKWSSLGFLFLAYPYFYFLAHGNFYSILIMQLLMALPGAGLYSLILTVIVEMIPPRMRCSLGGFIYSIAASVFGGTGPLIADGLIRWTGSTLAPAYYLIFCSFIGFISARASKPVSRELSIRAPA